MKINKSIKILKVSPKSEQETDPNVKCIVTFLENEVGADGIEESKKVNAKSYVEIPQTSLNKIINFEADVIAYNLNGKTGLSLKLKKVI